MAGTVRIVFTGVAAQLDRTLDGVSSKLRSVGNSLQDVGGKMSAMGQDLSMKLTLPILGVCAAAFKSAADLNDAMGATDQIFASAANAHKAWANKLPSYYGVAEGSALEYSNMMGSLLKNLGKMSDAEASDQAQKLTMLAGDLTAMFGGTTEDAVRALTGALKGNTSMLDNYGIAANEASIQAKALEMGIYNGTGAMTQQQKQAATLALIWDQTTTAQGQAKRESTGASGTLRALTTDMKNLATDIGTKLLPIGTKLLGWVKSLVSDFSGLSDKTQTIIMIAGGLVAALGPVVFVIGKLISVVGAVSKALSFLAANPVVLIIVAIAALAIALYVAYQKVEWFRNAMDAVGRWFRDVLYPIILSVASWLKDVLGAAVQWVADNWRKAWDPIWSFIQWLWDRISTYIQAAMDIIKGIINVVMGIITGDWSRVWDGIKSIATGAFDAVRNAIGAAWDAIKLVFNLGKDFVLGLWNGLWNGITNAVSGAWNAVKFAVAMGVEGVVGFIRDLPGRLVSLGSGMWNFISDGFKAAINALLRGWNALDIGLGPWTIPSWIPVVGGKTFGIADLFPDIPYLAAGGLAHNPTLAVVGDTPGDSEIVSPVKMMRQIVREEAGSGISIGRVDMITTASPKDLVNELRWMQLTNLGVS